MDSSTVALRLATLALLLGALSGCSAQYIRECNELKRAVHPMVERVDAAPPPFELHALLDYVNERVVAYADLANRLETMPVETPQLAPAVQEYALAARRYSSEARLYADGLVKRSPEQIDVARQRAAVEHGNLVKASRSVVTWCEVFGPK